MGSSFSLRSWLRQSLFIPLRHCLYTPRHNIFLEREFCTTMHFSVRISMTVTFYGVGMCKNNMGFGFTGRWEMLLLEKVLAETVF